MPDPTTLSEKNRAKLDGIVQQMVENKESDDNIKFVVDDFKTKYAEKKNPVGTSTSTIPKENTALAPTTGSSGGKNTQGFPEIDTNGIAPNYEEMKPSVENPIGKEKRLRKELANVKVTPENMDEISAMTDTLSATIKANQKAKDQAKSQRVKELETSFYDATRNNDDDAVAEQRLNDAVQTNGVWNNVKSISKKSYNTVIDAVSATSPTLIGLQSAKVNTDPLADEKKQAKQEATKNKQTLSETEINQRAQEIFKAKEKDNLFIDRANSFLDNMDDKDKELLKQDRANKAEHLQEDNLKRLKLVSAMRTVAQDKIDDYKKIESQLEKLKESGQPFPEDLYNQYTALGSEIKNLGAELQKNEDYILNNKKDLGTAQQELDLFKREYGDLYNFGQNVATSAGELAVNALAGLDYVATLGGNLDPGNKNKGVQEDLQKADNYFKETRGRLRKPVESVESVEGFVNYASDLMANQIPNLVATSTGAKGLGLIGTASAGKKFTDMNEEVRQGKASYSPLEMAVAPLLYGSAEVISEIPTLSILKKGGRVIESIAKNEGELIAKTATKKAVELAKDYGIDMSKEMAGEQFTNFTQNFNDKYVLGKKDVNLLDNTGQVFKDTFTLTSILKAAPHTFGAIAKPFQSKTDLGALDENSRKIIEFSKQLNAEGLTDTEKTVILKQIDKATAESSKIVAKTIGKINDMPGELYDEVVSLNSKAGEIKAQAREINDGTISNKTELLKGLGEDYKALQDKRNGIIDGSVSVVDVLPLKEQETLKKQAMEALVTELNPDGKKNITITNEQVVERANEIYAESKANTASTEPKIASTEPTSVLSEESNKTQTSPPSSSEVATPSVNPTIEVNSPLLPSEPIETGSEAAVNLPLKSKLSDEEKAKVQKKVVSKPRVILRSGKVGTDAFFALPNEGVFGDVVDKVGSDENVTAYRYPKDFKIKDLSNDVVFDEYMSKKMFEDTKKEGYDAAYVMEIDGSKVLHVINPEKLTLLDEKLPELRNNETVQRTNPPTDGNIRLGTEPMGKNGATKQESTAEKSVPKPNNVPTAKGEVTAKLQQINKKVFGLDDKKSKANTVVMEKTLETIAERTGKTKEEVFDSIHFEKGDAATAEKLSKKGKALFQIIGQNAKLSEQTKGFLEDAKTLEKQGAEAKTIFLQTGWEKGADGKWKYDMQEGTVEFKKTENGSLEDVLDYPELFDKYPEAKGIKIVFNGKMDMEGMFDASKNRIFINPSTGIKEAKVSLLHEIQHWVQKKEGFSKGGSTETAKAAIAEKINTEKNPSIKKALNGLKNLLFAKKVNAEKVNSELTRLEKLISKDDFELYQSIAGEVEARNVEKRYEMTDNERRNTSLSETEDVGRDEQVVLFQGEQGAMLAKDGEFIIYALTDPNVSTPLHEMAHVYEHYLTEAERNTLLKEAGHTTWSRETSEHFARGFEKYLADGIAPSPEMKTIFDNFKKWLTEIYRGIQDSAIDIRLSPEMKAVYNEMLGEKSKKETTDKPIQYKASENGKPYNVVFENGELKITDENGKAPSAPTRRVIEAKHADNFDFTKGETALDKQKINDVSTWEEDVAAHSENPVEVAETLLRTYTMDASEGLDTQSKHIAEAIGGKGVERSSFAQRAGKKGMKDIPGSLAMQYFAPKGKGSGLDIIAQNAEIAMYGDWDSQNPRITEDDVFDFINDNPRGTVDYLNSAKKEKINALKTAFTHLTGLPTNEKYLGKAIEQGAEKDFRLKNEEVLYQYSDEDLVSLSNEFDQFTKEENGKSEKTSEVNGNGTPILDKQNQEASEGKPGIQEARGRTTGTESQGKPEEVTPEGGITNDGELANEHNRTKSLVSERVAYEKVTPKNPPKKLSEIIKQVSTALKTTLIYGKSKRGGAGSYNPTNALVRISRAGDIDTVAHELGHLLDDRHDILGTIPANLDLATYRQLKWYSERGGSNPLAKASKAQKADYLQREGLAEFIRSLIANPTQTKIVAPELLQHFETVVDEKTQEILKDFSKDFLDFANASNIEKTLANVEDLKLPNKNKFIEWLKGFRSNDSGLSFTNMDKFYSEMANSNHFGIKAFKALLDMSGKSDIKSHENFEIMSRVFLGINGKLENIFGSGLINAKNEKLKAEGGVFKKDANGRTVYEDGTPMTAKWLIDGLDTTSEETLNKEMNEVVAMAIAERTIEYAKKFGRVTDLTGIGGSVDTDLSVAIGALNEFEDLKKSNPEKYNRIKDGVERYRKMADAPLRYAVDKGRISEEQYKLIKDSNEYYVALNRNIELVPGEDMFVAFGGSSNAIGSAKEIIKKSKGGTETIENPYLSLLANINNIIKESDRNEVMSSFVEPLLNMRTMGDGTPIDFSQIGRLANEGDKNTISVYRDGKLEKWQFEENIYKGLKNIESISSDPILSLFAKPSQLIRWTVTHNPVFYARNIVKDTQARMIVSNDHSSFKDMIHNSSDRELFELYGGSQAGHLHTGKDSYSKAMVTAAKEITAKGGMIINPMNWGKKYVKFLQSGENINRIAEFNNSYKKAKAQGMSDYDAGLYAAFQARDLMDFAVAGHTMRKINQIVVFSNAGVQSIRKAGKSLQRDPYGFAYRTGLYSVLPTIAFSALRAVMGDDDDDEEYEQLPDNQRDLFFNFKLPLLFGDAWVSIPKPYELGLTSSLVDRGISKIRGNDSALDGFMGTTIKTIMPFDESSFLGGLKPIVETAMNRNTYTGAPIVPEHESGKLLELRKGKSKSSLVGQDVSLLFKQAGLSVDPRNIDHIMKGYGTYFASQGMAITDLGKKEKTPLNFWIKQSGFAKDVASYNAKSVKKASDLAVEIGKINSGEMKDLRNKIEEFALETDLKKRKELTKTIYTDAKDIVKKYSAEKENAILYREKQLELEANLDAIADKVPARELRDNPEYIKAKKALTDYNESIKKPSN